MYRVGVAEEMFCAAITQGCAPPASVHVNVWRVHSSLSAALQCIGTQSPYLVAQVVPSVKLRGCAAGDDVLASLRRFVCQGKWRWGTKQTADRCTWVAVMLEYIFTCGFQGSFLNKALTAGVLTRRFRDGFLHVLKHHGTVCPAVNGLRHLKSFGRGFKALSGFTASREFCHRDRFMVACLTDAEQFSQLPRAKRVKPSAAVVLLWDKIVCCTAQSPLHACVVNHFLPTVSLTFGGSCGLQRLWVKREFHALVLTPTSATSMSSVLTFSSSVSWVNSSNLGCPSDFESNSPRTYIITHLCR